MTGVASKLKAAATDRRYIILTDVDRPNEPLEVEPTSFGQHKIVVAIPNTIVQFPLFKNERTGAYEGVLGGRVFSFAAGTKPRK